MASPGRLFLKPTKNEGVKANENRGSGYYGECHKTQSHLGGKVDGCQEFRESSADPLICLICGCHQGYHRKVPAAVPKYTTEVVYMRCHKVHDTKVPNSVDGCQEFTPGYKYPNFDPDVCELCGCKKGYHRNEITREVI